MPHSGNDLKLLGKENQDMDNEKTQGQVSTESHEAHIPRVQGLRVNHDNCTGCISLANELKRSTATGPNRV
jgi:hypothetical protein